MSQNLEKISIIEAGEVSTARLETLVDGVFAIAMTLLVLSIQVPEGFVNPSPAALFSKLVLLWPIFLSFLASFIILGMFWVAHHTEFRFIRRLDNKLIWLNMFYLLFVALLPFSAGLLGRYPENQIPVIIYAVHLICMVLLQYFMWRHARSKTGLLAEGLHPNMDKLVFRVAFAGAFAYLTAILFSFWNVNISLIIYALVPLPYIFGWIYYIA